MELLEEEGKRKEPKQEDKRNKKKRNKAIDMLEKRRYGKRKVRSRLSSLGSIKLKNIGMEENANEDNGIWNHGMGSRGVENCGTERSKLTKSETGSRTEESIDLRSSAVETISNVSVELEENGNRNRGMWNHGVGSRGVENCGTERSKLTEFETGSRNQESIDLRSSAVERIPNVNVEMEENGNRNHGVGSRGVENCGTANSTLPKSKTERSTEESTGIKSTEVEMAAIENVGIKDPGIRNHRLDIKRSGNDGIRSLEEMSCCVEECREKDWELQVETEAQVLRVCGATSTGEKAPQTKVLREVSRNNVVPGIDIENITVENVDNEKLEYENKELQDHRNTDLDLKDYLPGAVEIKGEQNVDEDGSDRNIIDCIDSVDIDIKDDVSSKNELNQNGILSKYAEQRSTDNDTADANNKKRRLGCFPVKKFRVQKKRKEGHVIDKYSRALFPSTFIIFNAVYAAFCIWSHVLTES